MDKFGLAGSYEAGLLVKITNRIDEALARLERIEAMLPKPPKPAPKVVKRASDNPA